MRRLLRDGVPLSAGRERRAAAAHQPRVDDFANDRVGPISIARRSASKPPCARYSPMLVGSTTPTRRRRLKVGLPLLGHAGRASAGERLGLQAPMPSSTVTAGQRMLVGGAPASVTSAAGARSHLPRHGDAPNAEAACHRSRLPSRSGPFLERRDTRPHPGTGTRHRHRRGRPAPAGAHRQQRLEGRDTPGVGGRHVQPLADVAEAAFAYPPHRACTCPRTGSSGWRSSRASWPPCMARPPTVPARSAAVVPTPVVPSRNSRLPLARRLWAQRAAVAGPLDRLPNRPAVPVRSGLAIAVRLASPVAVPAPSPTRPRPSPRRPRPAASRPGSRVALNSAVHGFGFGGVNREVIGGDLFGEVERHEREPGRGYPVDPRRRPHRPASRGHEHDLSVLDPEPLSVLGREIERLAAVQRRAVQVRLRTGVVGLEPPARGQADREVLVEFVDRRLERRHAERRQRPLDRVLPQPAVEVLRSRVILGRARPLQPAVLGQPVVRACRRASGSAFAARPTPLRGGVTPVEPEASRGARR